MVVDDSHLIKGYGGKGKGSEGSKWIPIRQIQQLRGKKSERRTK